MRTARVKTVAADNLTPMHHQPIKTEIPSEQYLSRAQDQQHRKPVDHWFADVMVRGGLWRTFADSSITGVDSGSGNVKCPVEYSRACMASLLTPGQVTPSFS
jgi:hypothetical protein